MPKGTLRFLISEASSMNFKTTLGTRQFNHSTTFTLWLTWAAFAIHEAVFAFRKPFVSVIFRSLQGERIAYKTALILSPVLGGGAAKEMVINGTSGPQPQMGFPSLLTDVGGAAKNLLAPGFIASPLKGLFFLNALCFSVATGVLVELVGERRRAAPGSSRGLSFPAGIEVLPFTEFRSLPLNRTPAWSTALLKKLLMPLLRWFSGPLPIVLLPNPKTEGACKSRFCTVARGFNTFIHVWVSGLLRGLSNYLSGYTRQSFNPETGSEAGHQVQQVSAIRNVRTARLGDLLPKGMTLINSTKATFGMNLFIISSGTLIIGVAFCLFQNEFPSLMLRMMLVGSGLYLVYVFLTDYYSIDSLLCRKKKPPLNFYFIPSIF